MAPKNLLKGFKRPSKIVFEHEELQSTYGKFVAEPFEKGFGLTLGNSLRRVLLSVIEGSAVTAVKIQGVLHEFSTIEGVYEDVTKIIYNIKQLGFKYEGDLPKVLHIVKSGVGELTGKDFDVDSEVEIMNPDVKVATLNKEVTIDMEVQIEKGRGYVPAEFHEISSDSVGVLPVDAIFTPIKKVNVVVENTRVGQNTDYDKLILEIWTDGSIAPDDALAHAAKILKDHLTIFINFEEEIEEEVEVVDENLEKMRVLLAKSIDEIELSVRAYNIVKSLDISTLDELVKMSEGELKKSKHFSEISLHEIKTKLEALNLSLGLKS